MKAKNDEFFVLLSKICKGVELDFLDLAGFVISYDEFRDLYRET